MKLENSFKNMFLSLTGIALVAAFLLSAIYLLTKDTIENAKQKKQQEAIRNVLPKFDHFDTHVVDGLTIHRAYLNDKFVGAAVESFSPNGFSGEIRIIVGFDTAGNIINYNVLEQQETPGLGTKIVDWFKTPRGNIIGKNPSNNILKLKRDGGEIDGITASTISSRAFLEAVAAAYNAFANNLDNNISILQKVIEQQTDSIKNHNLSDFIIYLPEPVISRPIKKKTEVNEATYASVIEKKKQDTTKTLQKTFSSNVTYPIYTKNANRDTALISSQRKIKDELHQKIKNELNIIIKKDTTHK